MIYPDGCLNVKCTVSGLALIALLFVFNSTPVCAQEVGRRITGIEAKNLDGKTQVTISADGPVEYRHTEFKRGGENLVVIDISDAVQSPPQKTLIVEESTVSRVVSSQYKTAPNIVRVVVHLKEPVPYLISKGYNQIVLDIDNPFYKVSLPEAVTKAKPETKLVTFNFVDTDIRDVFKMLSEKSDLNIVLDPSVTGKVTLALRDVPMEEAMELILRVNSLSYHRIGKSLLVASPEKLDAMVKAPLDIDKPQPQIMLEARVVEISATAKRELGFKWPDALGATSVTAETEPIKITTFEIGDIDAMLRILEEKGEGKVLANPRIATMNNQTARMLIGDKVPYTVTTVVAGVATTEVRYIEAGIGLEITPQIGEDGFITVRIKTTVSDIPRWRGDNPEISTREAEAILRVKDGETIVMSGLLKEKETETWRKVPILGHIPVVGFFFSSKVKETEKTELIITVTPHIL